MGKSLAEFRKASEDFKRTWEREVDLESVRTEDNFIHPESMQLDRDANSLEEPLIQRVSPDLVMPRQDPNRLSIEAPSTSIETGNETTSAEPLRKRTSRGVTPRHIVCCALASWIVCQIFCAVTGISIFITP